MTIYTWSGFSKRINSTKQPAAASGTQRTVLLKDGCDVKAPVFTLNTLDMSINYVNAFGNYYFAEVKNLDGHRSEIRCTLDVLATFKSNIGGYGCMVERSAGAFDDKIFDPMIYPTGEIVQSAASEGDLLTSWDDNGSYVVTIVGKQGLERYILTLAQVKSAFNTFFDDDFTQYLDHNNLFQGVEEAIQALFVASSNPSQYVKSVMWFPFDMSGTGSEEPYFGYVPGGATVSKARVGLEANTIITIPARYYNDYRDYDSRFTSCTIYLPGYGAIDIDAKHLQKQISVFYSVDGTTGAGEIILYADNTVIAGLSCQMGCNVAVGGITGTNVISGIAKAATNALTLNAEGVMGGLSQAIEDRLQPPSVALGASGNRYNLINRGFVQATVTRLGSSEYPTATSGRPTWKNLTLGGLSGYIKCSNASVPIPGDGAEQQAVNGYLNAGFYYE